VGIQLRAKAREIGPRQPARQIEQMRPDHGEAGAPVNKMDRTRRTQHALADQPPQSLARREPAPRVIDGDPRAGPVRRFDQGVRIGQRCRRRLLKEDRLHSPLQGLEGARKMVVRRRRDRQNVGRSRRVEERFAVLGNDRAGKRALDPLGRIPSKIIDRTDRPAGEVADGTRDRRTHRPAPHEREPAGAGAETDRDIQPRKLEGAPFPEDRPVEPDLLSPRFDDLLQTRLYAH
jgi:hypothetical protein